MAIIDKLVSFLATETKDFSSVTMDELLTKKEESLQKHDEVHHPDGYKEGDECKLRDDFKKENQSEELNDDSDSSSSSKEGGDESKSKFKKGMILKGWSNGEKYGDYAPKLQVVDVSEDGRTVFAMRTDDKSMKAYKYHVEQYGDDYRIIDKNGSRRWIWNASASKETKDVPEGWVSVESEHRKEGAKKATQTKSLRKRLSSIKDSITVRKAVELFAAQVNAENGAKKEDVISGVTNYLSQFEKTEAQAYLDEKKNVLRIDICMTKKDGSVEHNYTVHVSQHGINAGKGNVRLEDIEKIVVGE